MLALLTGRGCAYSYAYIDARKTFASRSPHTGRGLWLARVGYSRNE